MKPATKDYQYQARRGVNGGDVFPPFTATTTTLRDTADAIDTLVEHQQDRPEISLALAMNLAGENGVIPNAQLGFARAERLRLLAGEIERDAVETEERLAKAGEMAVEAEKLAEQLKAHRSELQQKLQAAREENDSLRSTLYDVTAQRDRANDLVEQAQYQTRAAVAQLKREQRHYQIAQRVIVSLIEDLEQHDREATTHADADLDLVFQVGAPDGVSPEIASDIGLAALLDSELAGIEN